MLKAGISCLTISSLCGVDQLNGQPTPANQRLKMLRWKLKLGGEDATSYLLCNSDYEWVRIDAY
jgi:hypothetical protein